MKPAKWEVWLVDMPYDEGIGSKVRPAVVLADGTVSFLVGKMTSHPPRRNFLYEYQVKDWRGAGLTCETTIRLTKTATLDVSLFLRKLGVLQPVDQVSVRMILKQIIK